MIIGYKKGVWYCDTPKQRLGHILLDSPIPIQAQTFEVHAHTGRVGPLIGVLIGGTAEGKGYGDWKRLSALLRTIRANNGIGFLFTSYNVKSDYIVGYMQQKQSWIPYHMPYPDVVYNRIPNRTQEQTREAQYTLNTLSCKNIPVFNSKFFSKWDVYKALSAEEQLQRYLPDTVLIETKKNLYQHLTIHSVLYIKQAHGAKGKKLLRITNQGDILRIERPMNSPYTCSLEALWEMLCHEQSSFIAQQAIEHDEHDGKKYDLRIVSHYVHGSFRISGVGVRVAGSGNIVTHVPNGGHIIALEALERPVRFKELEHLVALCGQSLIASFGYVREFSLDIGVDPNGRYYIFEANAKPMRFDEPVIEAQVMQNLVTICFQEAGFL
ncbi:YheC/YheD family protein [Ectobacillus antri]|uniref:YheC/YheD family protein n=1 Tax=Ectobacillus antri TaxID=2486280 RepID=A0ABT6H578_9BACI|nr:YheC/YheD family protein [Ectobacillus antri]MDG4656763.1 YheC/YheD family protein [Ectobacillus antri]MDG5753874.1 YheC/YheD family protein [Ectobacillus antri]